MLADFTKTKGDVGVRELNAFCKNKQQLVVSATAEREKKQLYWTCLDELIDPKAMVAMQAGFIEF